MVSKALAEPAGFIYEQVDGVNNEYLLSAKYEASDCCGFRSYIMVEFGSYGVLYFCYHHFNIHKEKLFESATYIRDESLSLTPNKLTGSEN